MCLEAGHSVPAADEETQSSTRNARQKKVPSSREAATPDAGLSGPVPGGCSHEEQRWLTESEGGKREAEDKDNDILFAE